MACICRAHLHTCLLTLPRCPPTPHPSRQVFSRGAKFSLFKPAEEMVYIGLDDESRTKGKGEALGQGC